jgi:cytochrome c-type biogenesis protein CcsB
MPVDDGLTQVSNALLTVAILAYTVAMLGYAIEYAFGRKGAVAARSVVPDQQRRLVGVGVGSSGSSGASGASGNDDLPDPPAAEVPDVTADAPSPTRWFGRLGVLCAVLGLAAQIGCLTTRGIAAGRVPWGNLYEFISVACAVGVTTWLVVSTRKPIRHLGMFVMLPVVLLLGLAGTVLYVAAGPLMPALNSYWLWIHVSTASVSVGIFLVGGVLGMLYLLRAGYEKRVAKGVTEVSFPFSIGARLPAADGLEQLTFRVHAFAFPIWTFAIICGAIWAEAAWSRYWGWDPKETVAFISWVVYAAYLHARATAGWRGTKAVSIAMLGFATMLVNIYVINFVVSGLHSYSGV